MKKILLISRSYLGFIYKSIYSFLSNLVVGKKSKMILITHNELYFLVDKNDLGVGLHLRKTGVYNQDEYDEMLKHVNNESNVLIIGAHIGAHLIPLSKKVKHVDAIEANPDTFEILSLNIFLNKCKNVRSYNFAAGNKTGEIEFLKSTVNSGGSKIIPKFKKLAYYYDFPKKINVEVKRVDNAFEPIYDLVTMDIEGSEYFALQGMDKILTKCSTLILEFSPDHLKNVSNTSISDFVNLISKYFNNLIIPGQKRIFLKSDFYCILNKLNTDNKHTDNIILKK